MIASLRGSLSSVSGSEIVVDVQGVGYQVTITSSVISKLPQLGQEVSLLVYTDVKETSISLFGFSSLLEKHVFILLQKVKGIGSRTALGILSGIGAELLLSHIGHGDLSELKTVPGVGKKTAERLIIELREHVGEFIDTSGSATAVQGPSILRSIAGKTEDAPSSAQDRAAFDAVLALEKLGFGREKAEAAVREAAGLWLSAQPDARFEAGELLKRSLAVL